MDSDRAMYKNPLHFFLGGKEDEKKTVAAKFLTCDSPPDVLLVTMETLC